jgi:hypothetical protein
MEETIPTSEEVYNPYSPVATGGGGGGLDSQLILDGNLDEPFNPNKVNYGRPREAQR